jgi:NADPH:quinone reductase-like Zn-dependent oxidoreductase
MKAIVYKQYGTPDVLVLKDVAVPVPKDDEVLVRVQAASINGSDRENLVGRPLYVRMASLQNPANQILGSDISGTVEKAGVNVKEFQLGDQVFGEIRGYHGGFAEYACASASTLARKPAGMTFEEAAAIPQAGVIAMRGIRTVGRVQTGQKVLINGAGGSAGAFAVQLAKLHGAEVTGVDNPAKLEYLRSLGADHVIDYTREDFTKNGRAYDLILDVIAQRSALAYRRALSPGGTYFAAGGSVATLLQILLLGPWISRATGRHLRILFVPQNREDLLAITELCETGEIKPVIDRTYPLSDVPEAFRYILGGNAKGKIVITMG